MPFSTVFLYSKSGSLNSIQINKKWLICSCSCDSLKSLKTLKTMKSMKTMKTTKEKREMKEGQKGCIYGYARISTKRQSIERQIRNIQKYCESAVVISEAYTGTKMNRPEWNKLLKKVKAGDTIIFDSVSRMSRNAAEGYETYMELFEKGVELVFLNEQYISTSSYKNALKGKIEAAANTGDNKTDKLITAISEALNDYMKDLAREQIRLAFEQSQKEVDDLRERTRQGLITAKLNGKRVGIPEGTKLTTKKSGEGKAAIQKYSKDFFGNLSDSEVMKLTGLSRNTYYKYKAELRNGI